MHPCWSLPTMIHLACVPIHMNATKTNNTRDTTNPLAHACDNSTIDMNHSGTRAFFLSQNQDDRAFPSFHTIFHHRDEKSLWRLDGRDSTGGLDGRDSTGGCTRQHTAQLYTFFWLLELYAAAPQHIHDCAHSTPLTCSVVPRI